MTLQVLQCKGQSNAHLAQTLGVTEAAVRYPLRRQGRPDGRHNKPRKADPLAQASEHWVATHHGVAAGDESVRPVNVQALHDWLRQQHASEGSSKSVLRFVRAHYPQPRRRPSRRVETPPGAQAQVDWGEFSDLDGGDGPPKLYAFVLVLSHSRKEVLVWCRRMDPLSWHHAHHEAFRRVDGIPAVLRIDNLKTGVARGAGPWGEVHEAYRAYARARGCHVDACLPRCPEPKGKVKNKVRFVKRRRQLAGTLAGLAELQSQTDGQRASSDGRRVCPAPGLSVAASWQAEQRLWRPLPLRPEPFDLTVTRAVQRDGTVSFEGRTYSVPLVRCGRQVEVRGCVGVVQVWHDGRVWAEHPRQTPERWLLDPAHYAGPGDERVAPPVPLGRMGRQLQEILEQPVEQRPLDLYAALAEVAL